MWTAAKIRSQFLSYFKSQGHTVVPSSPLVPRNDPTLMFTNAGMVQFKNAFTGTEKRDYTRAASSQKCVRAGGKHNDLENVGYTARHHTFFEMLGNFSFGDYFKEEAISYAWELVTKDFGVSPKRLLVTVYVDDNEAAYLWKKITGFSDDKILRIPGHDNFWSMGETGPCGPCSEIFYDHGEEIPGGPPGSPDQDGDRFVEIWNLVFMQYEQLEDKNGEPGKRINLPKPSIDTGMGLERIAAVLQGVHNNYEIDLFKGLIEASVDLTGAKAEGAALSSHRVITDHLRSACFLIADGVTPSNEGRGYVLRRIMRRAMRHAYLLGAKEPLMCRLVPALAAEMGEAYPELLRAQGVIEESLEMEEERFRQTLGRGLKLLEEEVAELKPHDVFPGDVAFKLYDTFGFPLDLTQDILRGQERGLDLDGFEACMEKQKAEARASWAGSGEKADESIWFELREKINPSEFLGYSTHEAQGVVQAFVKGVHSLDHCVEGQDVWVILNQTPFYAESGGQIGDTGSLISEDGAATLEVRDTLRRADLILHKARVLQGRLDVGATVTARVYTERRALLRANHSATHLLHATLRRHLGSTVTQKGSLVAPDRLRFDFSYAKALTSEQIRAVEDEVNALIRKNTDVTTRLMAPDEAVNKAGAMALFGEKYADEVRVVSMGAPLDDGEAAEHGFHSVELCGGTHVSRTGDIGYFKIVSETGIAAGIRRIEALTGPAAEIYMREREKILIQASDSLKSTPDDFLRRLEALLEERKRLEREVKSLQKKLVSGGSSASGPSGDVKTVSGIKFFARVLDGVNPGDLKSIADEMKKQVGSGIVAVASSSEGKASLVVGVTQDLVSRFNAIDLVCVGSKALGGKGGGGRPDMAQAGGPEGTHLGAALQAIENQIA